MHISPLGHSSNEDIKQQDVNIPSDKKNKASAHLLARNTRIRTFPHFHFERHSTLYFTAVKEGRAKLDAMG